jgi:hypothetical protein
MQSGSPIAAEAGPASGDARARRRCDQRLARSRALTYLNLDEIKALLAAPDRSTWLGRRDHAMPLLAVLTGVRVTELVTLTIADVTLGAGAHIKVQGKGRKRRATALTPETVAVLRQWVKELATQPHEPLFPTRQRQPITRSGVRQLLTKYTAIAATSCPSLNDKPISPHTLRHTNAMLSGQGASTSPRSPSGSGTRASRPPTPTSTPTRRSNKKRSTGSRRSAPSPADTRHPTRSSRSTKACDYALRSHPPQRPQQGKTQTKIARSA